MRASKLGLTSLRSSQLCSQTTYMVQVNVGSNGSASPNGVVVVDPNADHTITSTANAGYAVSSVIVDNVQQGRSPAIRSLM